MKIGQKVLITDGPWAGCLGEFAGEEETIVGKLYKVVLEDGQGTLVNFGQMKALEAEEPKQRATRVREIVTADGQQAWEYSDGSIRNWKGHPLPGTKVPNNGKDITRENARDMLARRRLVGLRAQLRGLARAEGVDPADVDDELLLQAGSAVEALTLHMAQTFKKSSSLRGMSEAYGALTAPLVGDRRQKDEPGDEGNGQPQIYVLFAQYIAQLVQPEPPVDAIDGTIKE